MMNLVPRAWRFLAFASLVIMAPHAAAASINDVFVCDAGDASYVVELDRRNPRYVQVTQSFSEQLRRAPDRSFRLWAARTVSGYAYESSDLRFFGRGEDAYMSSGGIIIDCVLQAKDVRQDHDRGPRVDVEGGGDINRSGRSLGGRLRAGPGTNFRSLGTLPEGVPLTIVSSTGVFFNGYDWFEVSVNGQRGYQWGGILCVDGRQMAGVYQTCPVVAVRPPRRERGDWMMFAIDERGQVGHGRAKTLCEAEQLALGYCGNRRCDIADRPVRGGCHAFADSQVGGYWFGIGHASNRRQATALAMRYCERQAPGNSCQIRYQHCQ